MAIGIEVYDLSLMFQALYPRIHNTASAPLTAAQKQADLAFDSDKNLYISTDTSAASDWKLVNTSTLVPSAGTTVRKTLAGPYTTSSASYVKVAEISVPTIYASGTFTVLFSLAHSGTTQPVYGRVYKNGSALGTEQSIDKDTPGPAVETENLAATGGDLLQVYAKRGSDATDVVTITAFTVKSTDTLTATTPTVTW